MACAAKHLASYHLCHLLLLELVQRPSFCSLIRYIAKFLLQTFVRYGLGDLEAKVRVSQATFARSQGCICHLANTLATPASLSA